MINIIERPIQVHIYYQNIWMMNKNLKLDTKPILHT